MPVTVSYPGVYLEELPSQVQTVTAATTSNAAMIDFFSMGPVNQAIQITSFNQFTTTFGGLDERSEASYAIAQFFQNGGSLVWVVRVVSAKALPSEAQLNPFGTEGYDYVVQAANPGLWGNQLAIQALPVNTSPPQTSQIFNLTVGVISGTNSQGQTQYTAVENYYNLSLTPSDPNFVGNVVNGASPRIVIVPTGQASPAASSPPAFWSSPPTPWLELQNGADGDWWDDPSELPSEFVNALIEQVTPGSAALDLIAPQVFNILCIPAAALFSQDDAQSVYVAAIDYCLANQAFMIVDPPPPSSISGMPLIPQWVDYFVNSAGTDTSSSASLIQWVNQTGLGNSVYVCAAIYYPWLLVPDPLNNYQPRLLPPSGAVAGLYAANDTANGVWKAPAGTNAVLQGSTLAAVLTNQDSGNMNPLGLNALRSFPVYGNIVWGARTLAGANQINSQFKYINVRRLTDFIEQSLTQSLVWAVFQDNAPPLWSSITLEVGAFMAGLFSAGAFQGTSASQAYFVQCDNTTTTSTDILNGVVNVVVGFAPVLPAEFIVLQIALQLGQSQSS